jgi:murein DD-endopeptidase MepM/ murein hydrolase activator NlpD
MAEKDNKKKQGFFRKLRNKYRLIIYNDDTFEEVWYFRLSRLNVIAVFGTGTIILIALVTVLIAFTSLKEFIPGYPEGDLRRNIISNYHKIDSLEKELRLREKYLTNLHQIMSGETPEDIKASQDTAKAVQQVSFTPSKSDSILREQIEKEEKYTLAVDYEEPKERDLSRIHFFAPVKGMITNSFNPKENHFGTDLVAGDNNVVVATLDGTVTMANWTLKTGYVIQIQHSNDILSVYKHNAELLKEVGDHVKAGEAIAIIGNSGELTSGPHLHFELWRDGTPIDPEKYIIF